MYPPTPRDPRPFESSEASAPGPHETRGRIDDGGRHAARAMVLALLILVAIVALIVLF